MKQSFEVARKKELSNLKKQVGTGSATFKNEIATPFGLAMTAIFAMKIYDVKH